MKKINAAIGMLLLVLSGAVNASLSRPGLDKSMPTAIQVLGAILDVDKIDSAEQNFTLNLYMIFRWQDPSLVHDGPGDVVRSLSEIWNPRLTIMNTQRRWANTKDEVEITPQGEVTYRLHIFGSFSQPMDLHDFPRDQHVFEVPVVAAGYRQGEVVFTPLLGRDSFMEKNLSVADWEISKMKGEPRMVALANGIKLPGFVFSFEGRRLLHHYVVKAIIPLVLIVMMSWVVFWIDPKNATNQLGVAVTTVLTLVAYHIALSGRLPVIPYLTQMDKFLFSSTLLVFLSLIEVVVTSHFAATDRLSRARRIDRTARWFFPILFGAAIYGSFMV
ncbi:MAG: hypothetical protein U9N50_06865 [Pseudomonadota bacterium]|nr:hypothetical protein [Pseudomonadota bacterium]